MKKLLVVVLCILTCFGLFGCVDTNATQEPNDDIAPNEHNEPNGNYEMFELVVETSIFRITLIDNQTAQAFVKMMPLTINMSELNGNEKYYYLPSDLPTDARNVGVIKSGDIMLFGSNCLVIFCENFSTNYSYTKIGNIDNARTLKKALGGGGITVTFDAKN